MGDDHFVLETEYNRPGEHAVTAESYHPSAVPAEQAEGGLELAWSPRTPTSGSKHIVKKKVGRLWHER